ncbi:hypothetical protein L1049_008743 [Liquidambar formosana]|uniref:DUF7477 domain-containing protein n=1 Tax=Liquidambar formosana TaxID=63359 RepID=A0AAP0X8G4_LIQFO
MDICAQIWGWNFTVRRIRAKLMRFSLLSGQSSHSVLFSLIHLLWSQGLNTDAPEKMQAIRTVGTVLLDSRLRQHVDKGNEDGLYISCVASSQNLWALIMDGGTGFGSQVYELSDVFLHKDWIMEQWEKNYYISSIAGANNGSSLVVMSKGTPYTRQSYKVSESFPFKWINKKWREGFQCHIDDYRRQPLGCGNVKELWIFSAGIHRRWESGYRITSMAATADQAAFILSIPKRKMMDETQETLRTSAFPSTHVKVNICAYVSLPNSAVIIESCDLLEAVAVALGAETAAEDRGFRGRGDGGRGGRFGGRGAGGGRGGFRDEGPPAEVVEISTFLHACEGDAVTKLTNEKIPYFNAPIYLQNKTQIGKVDEIFGPINESYFSIKMMEGIVATSYASGDKFYIDPAKLLPLARFLPQPKGQAQAGARGGGRGGGRGGFRGGGRGGGGFRGRGAPRGGRGGPPRGGARGGGFRGRGRF